VTEITTFCGKPLADFTREELIKIITDLSKDMERQRQEHAHARKFLLEAIAAKRSRKLWWRW
jgi:hypothetical protein